MSAVGTTPLQSPGCNEGKARNGTLGKHGYKKIRAPQERHYNASICLGLLGVPPLKDFSTSSQSIYFIILMQLLFVVYR